MLEYTRISPETWCVALDLISLATPRSVNGLWLVYSTNLLMSELTQLDGLSFTDSLLYFGLLPSDWR